MPSGLIRRNGRYSLRRVIPLDLQAHYGRREIVQALGTADPGEARKRHAKAWYLLDLKFSQDRRELQANPASQTAEASPTGPHPWETMSGEEFAFQLEQIESNYREAAKDELEEEETEAAQRELEKRLSDPRAVLTDQERVWARLLRNQTAKAEVAEEHAAIARSQAPRREAKPSATRKGKTPLSVVVDRWAAEQKPKPRTVTRTRNIVDRFEAVNGKLAVEDVTKHHVIAFKDDFRSERRERIVHVIVLEGVEVDDGEALLPKLACPHLQERRLPRAP